MGLNLLEKIQLPTLPSLYGAMLAGVDYVLIGAGILTAIVVWLGLAARGHRRIRIAGFDLELPGLGLTFAQMALGVIDLCTAASALSRDSAVVAFSLMRPRWRACS